MRNEVADAVSVAHQDAAPSPFVLEDTGQQAPVRVHRLAADRVERGHHRGRSRRGGDAEGLEVDVPEPVLGHVGRVVVPATLGVTVADEMLDGRGDAARLAEITALVAADHRRAHHAGQVRVFPEALDHPAPARVAAHVDHRGKRPVHSARRRLGRGEPGGFLDGVRVEAGGQRQRRGGDRAVAVNDVQADQQGNAQPGLLDRDPLLRIDRGRAARPEDRPGAGPDPAFELGRVGPEHYLHLGELLVPGHGAHQLLDAVHGA